MTLFQITTDTRLSDFEIEVKKVAVISSQDFKTELNLNVTNFR